MKFKKTVRLLDITPENAQQRTRISLPRAGQIVGEALAQGRQFHTRLDSVDTVTESTLEDAKDFLLMLAVDGIVTRSDAKMQLGTDQALWLFRAQSSDFLMSFVAPTPQVLRHQIATRTARNALSLHVGKRCSIALTGSRRL